MKRDLADMWNLVWELALLVCAGFALLNAFAPPQDLPWKPLDLDRPLARNHRKGRRLRCADRRHARGCRGRD